MQYDRLSDSSCAQFVRLSAFSQGAFFRAVDQAVPLSIWLGILSLSVEIIASMIG